MGRQKDRRDPVAESLSWHLPRKKGSSDEFSGGSRAIRAALLFIVLVSALVFAIGLFKEFF